MLILTAPATAELVIKRSRFIAELMSVPSQEGARETLREQKAKWSEQGITHLVHAFIVGPGANVIGCSDDGEPAGTAGRPVLEVLKGSGITNVMLTVARFFGGIKLGTGGLVKAYGDSAKAVLALAQTTELVPMRRFAVNVTYSSYERIKLLLQEQGATLENENFGNGVELTGVIREVKFEEAAAACRDATRGQAILQEIP